MPERLSAALNVTVPTSLEFVRPVRKMVEGLLSSEGWEEEGVADVGLVATELLQNAVEHGSRNDGTEHVDVHCVLEENGVVIEVKDPGTGKGPEALIERDVSVAPPLDAARGRGLFLVHKMVECMDRGLGSAGGCVIRVRFTRIEP